MKDNASARIAVRSDDWEPWLLRQVLEARIGGEPSTIAFVLSESAPPASRRNAIDSTVVIALLSGSGALGMLVSGLVGLLKEKAARKITIRGHSGWSLECPVDLAPQTIAAFIDVAKDLDVDKIEI